MKFITCSNSNTSCVFLTSLINLVANIFRLLYDCWLLFWLVLLVFSGHLNKMYYYYLQNRFKTETIVPGILLIQSIPLVPPWQKQHREWNVLLLLHVLQFFSVSFCTWWGLFVCRLYLKMKLTLVHQIAFNFYIMGLYRSWTSRCLTASSTKQCQWENTSFSFVNSAQAF